MKADVYNITNQKVGAMELPEGVFGVEWNPTLVHQVVTSFLSNQRKPWAHSKDRGDVSGGGKKPWRQKGTGRARHGSIRSPIWVHGGVAFGPRNERNYGKKINRVMKRAALFCILSRKLTDGEMKIVDNFGVVDHKTKRVASFLRVVCDAEHGNRRVRSLIVPAKGNRNAVRAGRNVVNNRVLFPDSLNVYDCLANKCLLFEQKAVEELISHCGNWKINH